MSITQPSRKEQEGSGLVIGESEPSSLSSSEGQQVNNLSFKIFVFRLLVVTSIVTCHRYR